jgi:radical SAM protein with 4Fe4S-binding SPASM domain
MRRDISGILEEIAKYGFEIYLLTNGILVDRDRARMLSKFGVKGVQVSIEGPETVHDSIRGKGSFSSALKGVQHLLDAGLVVTLNTTLSAINADSFLQMVELCSSLGVQKLGFSRLVPSGRGQDMRASMLDATRIRELYQSVFSAESKGVMLVTGDPVASQMSAQVNGDEGPVPCGGCAAGLSGLTILSDGTITPCRRLPLPIGNVKKDSLREVWATSPVLSALRDRSGYKGKCGTCKRWAQCRGCRAIAYGYSQFHGNGDFLAEDPQCFL